MRQSKTSRQGRLFKRPKYDAGQVVGWYSEWYGRLRLASGKWRQVKLFTDLALSRRKLDDLQKAADMRAEGYSTAEQDRVKLPLADLVGQYLDGLRAQHLDGDHVKISDGMLRRMMEAGKWQTFADITAASVERVVPVLAAKTVSYQNSYVKKIKAFVHWALPDGVSDPLRKLKRRRERGTKRNRARRAMSFFERRSFYVTWAKLPEYRHVCYALAMLNGLRRSNIKTLTWADVFLNATVPFVRLQQKMGDGFDYVALHPYVVQVLRSLPAGMPERAVVRTVPEVETLENDLAAAGVAFTNAAGERQDFHGLRHTFETALDATGCSRATKKKLMRHAGEDVTDGYAHAELAEMLQALDRVSAPGMEPEVVVMTGTYGPVGRESLVNHHGCAKTQNLALPCTDEAGSLGQQGTTGASENDSEKQGDCTSLHDAAQPCLKGRATSARIVKLRPDTQVD